MADNLLDVGTTDNFTGDVKLPGVSAQPKEPSPQLNAPANDVISKNIASYNQQETARLNVAVDSGLKQNPDQAAKVLDLNRSTGLDTGLISRNLDAVELQQKKRDLNLPALEANYPKTAAWLKANPYNSAAANGDVSLLSDVEGWFTDLGKDISNVPEAFSRGQQSIQQADYGFQRLSNAITGQPLAPFTQPPVDKIPKPLTTIGDFLLTAGEQAPIFGRALTGAAGGAAGGAVIGAVTGSVVPGPGTIAGAVTGAGIGGKLGAAYTTFTFYSGSAFNEYTKIKDVSGKLLDPQISAGAAIAVGAVNAGLELFSIGALLKTVPGGQKLLGYFSRRAMGEALKSPTVQKALFRVMARYTKAVGIGGAVNAAQELSLVIGRGVAEIINGGDFKDSSPEEIWNRVLSAGAVGLKASVVFGLPGSTISMAVDARNISKATTNFRNLSEGVSKAKESILRKRSPELFQEFLQAVTKDTKNISLAAAPMVAYLDSKGVDPAKFFNDLGVSTEDLTAALKTGADVNIETSTFLAKMPDNKFLDEALLNVRETADSMTMAEATIAIDEAKARVQKIADQVTAGPVESPTAAIEDQAAQVAKNYHKQAREAGVSANVASSNAALLESTFLTESANRLNEGKKPLDVNSFYAKMGLQITRNKGGELAQGKDVKLGSFDAVNPTNVKIKLFETADLSTLLHENGHLFTHMMGRMSELPDASQRLIDNNKALLEWVGAKSAEDLNVKRDGGRAKQEKIAVAFEAYLKDGKAPSIKLQAVFAQFAEWLKQIYDKVRTLGVKIDPKISEVFDKMLATDAQIAEMKVINEFDPSTNPTIIDLLSAEERKQWIEASSAADEVARNEAARVQSEVEQRAKQDAWLNELGNVKRKVSDELWKRPQYRAFWFLTRGKFRDGDTPIGMVNRRLDKQALLDNGLTQEDLNALPKKGGKRIYTSGEDATSPDILAPFLGFKNGSELVQTLKDMVPADKAIDNEAALIMRSRHGDPVNDGTLSDLTEQALYNKDRLKALHIELDAIARKTGQQKIGREITKAIVEKIIASRPLTELLQPLRYHAAAIRAAKASERANAKKDYKTAFEEKRKQILNTELLRRSLRAKKDVEAAIKYMRKFSKRGKSFKNIHADFVDKIRELEDAYQLTARLSNRKRNALNANAFIEWMKKVEKDDGAIFMFPREVLVADSKTHYRDLTLNQFMALRDTVKSLEAQGRLVEKGISAQEELARDDIIGQIEDRMARLKQTGAARRMTERNGLAWYDEGTSKLKMADAAMTKIEFLVEQMDGGPLGPAHRAIFQPIADAEYAENLLVRENGTKLSDAFKALPKKIIRQMNTSIFIPELGRKLTRGELLHLALNVGNESNLDKVIRGSELDVLDGVQPFTEDGIMSALDRLTKEEWDLVQTIWDLFENMYPKVEAAYRKENGIAPERVETREIVTHHGTYRGGYFPMLYDAKRSAKAKKLVELDALEMMQSQYVQASVNSSMTKGRTGFAAPVLLDFSRVSGELQKTAHFITHYEAVRNLKKILGDERIMRGVVNKIGMEYYNTLEGWAGQVATGTREKRTLNYLDNVIEGMRSNATITIMGGLVGGSVTTILSQPLGLFTSIDALSREINGDYKPGRGVLRMAQGLVGMLKPGAVKQAFDISKELQFRLQNSDRDIRHVLAKTQGMKGRKAQIQRMMLIGIPFIQLYTVDIPTFISAYNMGLEANLSEGDAVNYADSVVRKAQGSGSPKDQSALLAQPGVTRAFTMFMTFFNTLYNIEGRIAREAQFDIKTANKLVVGGIILFVLPTLIESLFRMEGPPENDKKGWPLWLAIQSLFFALSSVPLLRDVNWAIQTGSFAASPIEGLGKSAAQLVNTADKILDPSKELSAYDLKSAISLLGFTTGVVPANFINRIIGTANKIDSGDKWNIWEFFVGPKRKGT